jgi:hypothetical protein
MKNRAPDPRGNASRQEGVWRLAGIVSVAGLQSARPFLDAAEMSEGERMALAQAISYFQRPTNLEIHRAIGSFIRTRTPHEIKALNDLGNRIVPSEQQWRSLTAWRRAFSKFDEAPARLRNPGAGSLMREYVQFSVDLSRQAIDADEEEELDEADATHVALANIAQWRRLRPTLSLIETLFGEHWGEFLSWARRKVPTRAADLLPISEIEDAH